MRFDAVICSGDRKCLAQCKGNETDSGGMSMDKGANSCSCANVWFKLFASHTITTVNDVAFQPEAGSCWIVVLITR